MSLPLEPYQGPVDPYLAGVHNAGHALGCIATGRPLRIITTEVCQGKPLGLEPDSDLFGWAVICWAGPAAEAVAAFRTGTPQSEAAQWLWNLYQAPAAGGATTGRLADAPAADPAVVAVALSIADANWQDIERIALKLSTDAEPYRPAIGAGELKALIRNRDGADIGVCFETWARAVAEAKDNQTQAAGLRWP